ncbi:hypothetical protein CO058_03715 [candidate division WWE3 bacterium CG_4_9_14_0_2_um_filter_35_11]|uniref:Uncharacterized protein n=1 Tax=candidate division WWE3 bacterium CG_4_9_14_0_2_um_filter_35_11 TaxID=1975077 RepID=A0A2M8EL35_UNCKA|nr:MAG: hypothetical protein COV25_02415 [candidate division WWE3 bacterium CG10_big_fil_rev_8_21_14_0_10_35_32]PJC23410.1 MAG: hypothetical protein CO058_03715 [candidate division WWE3 bacterium CG_4_9_14_0_2_um_filter_35_11]
MKKLFAKAFNLTAPGGDNYEWKEAETSLLCVERGWHLIKIIASAKNAKQKDSTDDDDLRMVLNDYELGKYEIPQGKEHYKGFDNAASWNGATLKGNSKIVYIFFYATQVGDNQLQFYADRKPHLDSIEFYRFGTNETFSLNDLKPDNANDVDRSGIPWMSFIFIGPAPRNLEIIASAQSGKQKSSTDGDNLKVLVNGRIIQNEKAPTADKYKNFYFSGDQLQRSTKTLTTKGESFASLENSIEIWYDQNPTIQQMNIEFSENYSNLSELSDASFQKDFIYLSLQSFSNIMQIAKMKYTAEFMRNAISRNPKNLVFGNRSKLAQLIKKDSEYKKIITLIKEKIKNGLLIDEIFTGNTPENTIIFNSWDLYSAIHGIKKISYTANKDGNSHYKVDINLYDIYDFDPNNIDYSVNPIEELVVLADQGESLGVIKNFEILIKIHETF